MSGGNILQTLSKTYSLSDSGNLSCCRLCGSVKEVKQNSKSLHKTANEELVAVAEVV